MKCKQSDDDAVAKKYNGKSISAQLAPEPSDIFWENLGVPLSIRIQKLATTWIVTIFILAISFLICFGINVAQKDIYDDYKDGD
jgi:hypothetical protein